MTSTTVKRDVGLRVGGHCPYPSAACGLYRRSASDQRVAKGGLLLACGGVSVGLPVWQLVFASRAVGVHVWGSITANASSEGAQDLARPQGSHTCQCDYDPGMVCVCVWFYVLPVIALCHAWDRYQSQRRLQRVHTSRAGRSNLW